MRIDRSYRAAAIAALAAAVVLSTATAPAEATSQAHDHDGMPNSWESRHHKRHGNPHDPDTDNDGIRDNHEHYHHGRVNRPDSDGDHQNRHAGDDD
ncbi:hypothetical protein [Actinoplanes sp. NBRC 103695]|uniref:hypothetical protein n=1 Tax=Actinoplanes sp. NBRC 103695 TaxID=3032202 RepID=UPI0024A4F7F7|nr:hypothetical protein [Actinoplanes sp. NBRC 103695]GLY96840.1 hypothetical protein Acsp02_40940 [Actinoplanes sp. NBRC 103695]